MKKFIFITIYTFGIMLLSASPVFSKEFPASKEGCPDETTLTERATVLRTAVKSVFPIPSTLLSSKEKICVYEPPPKCPTGKELIGVTRLQNGDDTGGKCYVIGSAEAKEAIAKASNVQNAVGSKCSSGFLYVENVNGKKCYRANSDEYLTAANKAKLVKLGTGKVGGTVKQYVVTYPIPCQQPIAGGACPRLEGITPAGYIARLYQFGLMIVGLAAFGGIIYGSLKYILSAGNIGSQQDARDQITQAIMGLILLLGSFIILYTINPELVSLRNPNLEPIRIRDLIQDAEVPEDIQRLPRAGKGGADPLCKSAINAGITVNTSQVGGSKCVTCTTGATVDSKGICQCETNYLPFGSDACITPKECKDLGYKTEAPNGNGICSKDVAGEKCVQAGGVCQKNTGPNSCPGGKYEKKLCPGAADIQCCIK